MKKVSELTGSDLDYWALMARNISAGLSREDAKNGAKLAKMLLGASPSKNWAEGGAIIEKNRISVFIGEDGNWWGGYEPEVDSDEQVYFQCGENAHTGETPLIAAMRTFVASVYGDEVPTDV